MALLASSSAINSALICRASSLSKMALAAAVCWVSSNLVMVCSMATSFSVTCVNRSFRVSDVSISSTSVVGALGVLAGMVGTLSTAGSIGKGATVGILGVLAAATGFSALPAGDSPEIEGLANGVLGVSASLLTVGGDCLEIPRRLS